MSQKNKSMILISMKIEKELLEEVDKVVREGLYSSRSEFIREAIRQLLIKVKISRRIDRNA